MAIKTIILFFISIIAINAQIKIDNLTVSDYLAKEYFFDCIKYPDTLWFFNYYWTKEEREKERKRFETDSVVYFSGTSRVLSSQESDIITRQDYIEVVDKDVYVGIINGENGYRRYGGYTFNRKPSAQDFMKWYLRKYKTNYN